MTAYLSPFKPSFKGIQSRTSPQYSCLKHSIHIPVSKTDIYKRSPRTAIHFSATAPLIDGYPAKDLQLIWDVLQRCKYRKPLEQMIPDDSPFQVQVHGDKIILKGKDFYPPKPDGPILGACNELSHFAMRALQQELGKRYEFAKVQGNCSQYFREEIGATHTYLLARRRRTKWFSRSLEQDIRQLCESGQKTLPPGCLLIDPSFSVLKSTNHENGYLFTDFLSSDAFKDDFHASHHILEKSFSQKGLSSTWPLGRLEDLIDLSKVHNLSIPPSSLVLWDLIKTSGMPQADIELCVQSDPAGGVTLSNELLEELKYQAPDNPLRCFVNKVRVQLGHQDII